MDPNNQQPQNDVPAAAPPELQNNTAPPNLQQTPPPQQNITPSQFQAPSPQAPTQVTPPQPQFQAVPPQADVPLQPSSSGKSKALIAVIVGVLMLIGVAAAAFFLLKGSGVGKSEPEKAITGFVNAAKNKDCAAFVEFYANSNLQGLSRSEFAQRCEEAKGTENDVFKSIEGKIPTITSTELTKSTDTEATVKIIGEIDGRDGSEELNVLFEEGKWRIDF